MSTVSDCFFSTLGLNAIRMFFCEVRCNSLSYPTSSLSCFIITNLANSAWHQIHSYTMYTFWTSIVSCTQPLQLCERRCLLEVVFHNCVASFFHREYHWLISRTALSNSTRPFQWTHISVGCGCKAIIIHADGMADTYITYVFIEWYIDAIVLCDIWYWSILIRIHTSSLISCTDRKWYTCTTIYLGFIYWELATARIA